MQYFGLLKNVGSNCSTEETTKMAIRMQGYRTGTPNMGGGFQRPATSVPPTGRNAPGTTTRIDVGDIFKNMTGRTISNDGSPIVDAALGVAKMIPGLARLHPYLRIADLLNIAWKIWRSTKLNRDRTSFSDHDLQNIQLEQPLANGWTLECSAPSDPTYPYPDSSIYAAGNGGGQICGVGFQQHPPIGPQSADPSWPGATKYEFDWGPNVIGFQDRSYVRAQWGKANAPYDETPYTNLAPTNSNEADAYGESANFTPPVSVLGKINQGYPSTRGNSEPGTGPNTEAGSGDDWPPLYSFRTPPGGRVKEVKFKATALNKLLHTAVTQLGALHGKLTDLKDIVKALDESLPKHLQSKSKRLQDIIANVYKHADKLHASKALLGIIKELAEDQVGGLGDHFATESAIKNGWTKQKFHLSARF